MVVNPTPMREKLGLVVVVASALCGVLSMVCGVVWVVFLVPMIVILVAPTLKLGLLLGIVELVGSLAGRLLRRGDWLVPLAISAAGTLLNGVVIVLALALVAWS